MLNLLSYVGMSLQSELCLWTLLGLLRTIFDATLFKVNANLKQVWQMTMPQELSMPVQRALRTMISGVMLVQCFTVYVYLASYIVLLYPIFLEERPTLVLPWLLLAAVRKFLCELVSLSLGLGVCVLVGPARPACIRFVVFKITRIIPAVYMWLLVLSYYNALKVTAAFKRFPTVLPPGDIDYGLELAVRRRRTKSLMDERHLRKKISASFSYGDGRSPSAQIIVHRSSKETDEIESELQLMTVDQKPKESSSKVDGTMLEAYEDWCGSELVVPRDTDRVMEQFVLMLLRISAQLTKEETGPEQVYSSQPSGFLNDTLHICEDTDTPPTVGNDRTRTTSYLQRYPQIFMKKDSWKETNLSGWEESAMWSDLAPTTSQPKCTKTAEDKQQFEPEDTTFEKAFEQQSKDFSMTEPHVTISESKQTNAQSAQLITESDISIILAKSFSENKTPTTRTNSDSDSLQKIIEIMKSTVNAKRQASENNETHNGESSSQSKPTQPEKKES